MARLAVIGSLVAAALIALGPPARAGTADEVVGLFTEACLPFAGTPARLRDWAARNALTDMPDPARTAFLNGAAGKVFDASSSGGKFVLLSSDDGLCAAIAQQAKGADVVAALEQELGKAGVAFRLAIERDDKVNPALHHREYLATLKGRVWRILVATVNDRAGGRAMLTAAPG